MNPLIIGSESSLELGIAGGHVKDLASALPPNAQPKIEPIQYPLSLTKERVVDELIAMPDSIIPFLRLMGVIWNTSHRGYVNIIQCLWSSLIRIALVFLCIVGVVAIYYSVARNTNTGTLYGVAYIIQSLVLWPSLFYIHKRLNTKAPQVDLVFYSKSRYHSMFVFVISIVLGLVFPIFGLTYGHLDSTMDLTYLVGNLLAQISISCFLSVNMMLVGVDCGVCILIISDLINQMHSKSLTMERFNDARNDIHQRVKHAKFTNDLVVATAVLNVILLLLVLYLSKIVDPLILLATTCVYLREIPYLLLVFLQTAKVNDKSDELLTLLGTAPWGCSVVDQREYEYHHSRVMLYINAQANLISFPLAGLRLNTTQVYVRVIGWVLAFAVGVIRTFLLSKF